MEPIGDNQDHSYYRESSESILEKNHDEQGLSTDSGLTAIKAKDNDDVLLEELLSSIDDIMKNPNKVVDITKHQDETDKATTKTSQSSLSSIISSIRLSNKRNTISSNLCNSVQNVRQRISNEVIKCDPHMYWHFDLKQRNDATDYWTNGCVWVGEFIAVAIGESDLVNLIDIRHRSVVSTFYCDSEPFSITAIANGEYLMICLTDSNKIDVLTIFDRCLTCVLEIDCEVPIFDIVHLYDCVFYCLASIKGDLYEIHLDGLKLSKL
ncbi:hypothetical protein DPMN_168971 [Dreissena polymorpha]|uniref:Uncharacterized protein n=1 Tax=Dreissena polymorpha TaxID=45954 RepID=A0A9D4F1P9_DREPO|nr:hypothetical protein DPMN_168971 [Dreissena polymorpha]